jgi:SAM-dependent methyltransferase
VVGIDEWWQQYGRAYEHRTWRDYRHILGDAVRYGSTTPLLDVGCGYGFLVECARQFGIPAMGLELSPAAIAECRARHPAADVRRWEAGRPLPLESDSIGIAILNQFVEHITLEQNRCLFSELTRVLKPDGLLLAYSSSRFNRFDTDAGHVTFFSPSEFRAFVSSFGFHVAAQPYLPQPLVGTGRIGRLAMGALTRIFKPERWAATIDLVAYNRPSD